jgi:uncharacterized protein
MVKLSRRKEMVNNPVIWFEILVQDMSRAKTFYESVFQVKLDRLNTSGSEMWAFPMAMDRVGVGGALVKTEGGLSGENSIRVYFSCADCAVEAALVPKYGGKVYREKMSIGEYGFIALILDTEGNLIGLHSMQ